LENLYIIRLQPQQKIVRAPARWEAIKYIKLRSTVELRLAGGAVPPFVYAQVAWVVLWLVRGWATERGNGWAGCRGGWRDADAEEEDAGVGGVVE